MKIALISDIHSNHFALLSVLADIRQKGITAVYCLGDSIGYHSMPNEVLDCLRAEGVISIKGNHDRDITEKLYHPDNEPDFIKRWTDAELRADNHAALKALPEALSFDLGGQKVRLVHGSPQKIDEYLFEGTPEAEAALVNSGADVLVCAHTHLPYVKAYGQKLVINTGSVGKPKTGRPHATYITLAADERTVPEARIEEVAYDFEAAARHVEQKGLPQKFADALRTGKA